MPNENSQRALDVRSKGAFGMEAASEIFYDLVTNYKPSLLSPQYDMFSDAAQAAKGWDTRLDLAENQVKGYNDDLTMMTFAQTLAGLEAQALSFRREAYDREYPTQHYKDHVLQEQKVLDNNVLPSGLKN